MSVLAVPNEILQRAYERRPARLLKVPFFYGLIALAGYAAVQVNARNPALGIPAGIFAGALIGMLVRGIGSVGHDAVHGSVSRNKLVSYLVGFWAWSATLMSYTLYRQYHLDHHRIVNMPHDVDRVQTSRFTSNPTAARRLRLAIYLGLYPVYWAREVQRYAAELSPWLKVRMFLELATIYSVVLAFLPLMGLKMWLTVVVSQLVIGAVVASLTSMLEHFGIEYHPDHGYSSRTYATKSALADFFWSGTIFHNEHHTYPGIPYYNLKQFHFEALPHYPASVTRNVHEDLLPLVGKLFAQAAAVDPDEERATAERDRQRIARESSSELPSGTAVAA